jgi:hypothetical protein
LRLKTVAPIPEDFRDALHAAWAEFSEPPGSPLEIKAVDEIAPAPSGKLLDFLSEHFTDAASPFVPASE